jgi:hypothetical protein
LSVFFGKARDKEWWFFSFFGKDRQRGDRMYKYILLGFGLCGEVIGSELRMN